MKTHYCGADYFPKWLRRLLSFPLNRACRLHDRFYEKKNYSRLKADYVFFIYCLKHSSINLFKGALGLILSPIYFLAVILFGIISWRRVK